MEGPSGRVFQCKGTGGSRRRSVFFFGGGGRITLAGKESALLGGQTVGK